MNAISAYLSLTQLLRSLFRLYFQQLTLNMTRTWRTSDGEFDWYNFACTLSAAATFAHGMGLSAEQAILERTRTRGQFLIRCFRCPAVPLGAFTDKLPNTRGLTKSQIDQNLENRCVIQKAQGSESTVGKAPAKGDARGRGYYGASAPRPSRSCGARWALFAASAARRLCSASGGRVARGRGSPAAGCAPVSIHEGGNHEEEDRQEKRDGQR